MKRLDIDLCKHLPDGIEQAPALREQCGKGIVHLGIGAFHRAHQAVFTEDAIQADGGDWLITGVSLRSAGVREQMGPQQGLYTVIEKSSDSCKYRLISVIKDVLVAPENPQAVVDLIADSSTRIVSMTITEKGYCCDFVNGGLDKNNLDVQADLSQKSAPKTMPGMIVAASSKRRESGAAGYTLMSCDNLSNNGKVARQVVLDFAELVDASLKDWIGKNVTFPSTMVDRIVPATTESDKAEVSAVLGCEDLATVACEPFKQWVIEESFASGRPAWDKAGALLVDNVMPFETMKLRLLNGSHSALAYLGRLAGYEYIHQAISDSQLRCFIEYLMIEEVSPTLCPPEGFDLNEYRESLVSRFENQGICYKTTQVGSDGSQKLPQRLLEVAVENLAEGRSIKGVTLVIAAWFRYMLGRDDEDQDIQISDPLAEKMQAIWWGCKGDCPLLVQRMTKELGIFNAALIDSDKFSSNVSSWLKRILDQGVSKALVEFDDMANSSGS